MNESPILTKAASSRLIDFLWARLGLSLKNSAFVAPRLTRGPGYPKEPSAELRAEIAAHNAAVDVRKAEKRAAKEARRAASQQ